MTLEEFSLVSVVEVLCCNKKIQIDASNLEKILSWFKEKLYRDHPCFWQPTLLFDLIHLIKVLFEVNSMLTFRNIASMSHSPAVSNAS